MLCLTVNKEKHKGVIRNLHEALRRRCELWSKKSCTLHHENVLSFTSLHIPEPQSPDVAYCDFFYFSNSKRYSKYKIFEQYPRQITIKGRLSERDRISIADKIKNI